MPENNFGIAGLNDDGVLASRTKSGTNQLIFKKENKFLEAIKSIAKEPMIIILLAASSIYFISGKIGDGLFMAMAILIVAAISLFQDSRSRNALAKLKTLTQPHCKVIRNGVVVEILSEDIVLGDSLMVEEGSLVAADATIVHSNDFSVNESIITGESMPLIKDKSSDDKQILLGTTVVSGLAIAEVTAIGNETRLGKIGKSLESIEEEKTPLEIQINSFVKYMVIAGAIVFLIVWGINYFKSYSLFDSLLKALTLAMSILPEEIPVAFTTFMALGAWRLMKNGVVVKQMKTVETLGSTTVICSDKTGTLTENKMTLSEIFLLSSRKTIDAKQPLNEEEKALITLAMWASEPIPFDPMEVSLHNTYKELNTDDQRPAYKLVHEYPLSGKPPMMTHVFENDKGDRIIAAKGAPEALLAVSKVSEEDKGAINTTIQKFASLGYRVLGVGVADFADNNYPEKQQDLQFRFMGLVAFNDPPKANIGKVLEDFYKAGIMVKIITGDNAETTAAIAQEIGFVGYDKTISGDDLMKLSDAALKEAVMVNNIFTRMFPEAKLKIINALKANNQIVAMTGDGVNDGPALKAAHIGIAMGKQGTEIAKQAASLILMEDDLSKMVEAIGIGRRIYTNLKKAIQYIISIHIPIILTVFIPLALAWKFPNIFSPLHIIFLELIMGPTCSVIYENEPMEKNTMVQKPRALTGNFFNWNEFSLSVIQGLVITAGTLLIYQYAVRAGYDEAHTRTMVFTVLIVANIFLTLINRSFFYSIFTTLRYKNNLVILIIGLTILIEALLLYIKPLTLFFGFEGLSIQQGLICIAIGFVSVIWFEFVKLFKRIRSKKY